MIKKWCDKKGIATEYLVWILIGIALLSILMITLFFLKDKGISLIDQIKNLFRGR